MKMGRPHIEKTTRYYNQTDSVSEPSGCKKKRKPIIHGEETWKRIGVIFVKDGENYKNSQRIGELGM
jgi:hypothetical protein